MTTMLNGLHEQIAKSSAVLEYGGHRITVSIEDIYPADARKMLEKNDKNRHVTPAAKSKMKGVIRRGEFVFNGETIVLASDGTIVDGQTRLIGVVEANAPIRTLVVRGIEHEDAFGHHGLGRRRNLADWLSIEGYDYSDKLAAACTAMHALRSNGMTSFNVPSIDTAKAMIAEYPELVWASRARRASPVVRGSTKMALSCFMVRISGDDEVAFWEALETGANQPVGSPILIARARLIGRARNEQLIRRVECGTIIQTWNHWRNGTKLPKGAHLFRYDSEMPELQ